MNATSLLFRITTTAFDYGTIIEDEHANKDKVLIICMHRKDKRS